MKALLIDDERLARNELRRLLAAHPEIEIVGEAANAKQAREQIAALTPELLFLDVQMPGETGMALLESLEPPAPQVIFTTAFDEFAVKAFELNALDYLLKPVDPVRLAAAVERLQAKVGLAAAVEKPARLAAEDKVFVREGDDPHLVAAAPEALDEAPGRDLVPAVGRVGDALGEEEDAHGPKGIGSRAREHGAGGSPGAFRPRKTRGRPRTTRPAPLPRLPRGAYGAQVITSPLVRLLVPGGQKPAAALR